MTSHEYSDHLETPQSAADTPVYSEAAIAESLTTGMRIATAREAGRIANYGTRAQVVALRGALKEIQSMRQGEEVDG